MKHGPLALVDEHLPIVVVATRDSMYSKMESVIQQLLARNARLVIVATEGDENMQQYVKGHDCRLIEVSTCSVKCGHVVCGVAVGRSGAALLVSSASGFDMQCPNRQAACSRVCAGFLQASRLFNATRVELFVA
jgi:hypothetical protein